MIRLNDKYAICGEQHDYLLCEIRIADKDMKTTSEITGKPIKTGDEYLVSMNCYSGTVNHCIYALIRKLQRDVVVQTNMPLIEAAKAFAEIENRVHGWCEGAGI